VVSTPIRQQLGTVDRNTLSSQRDLNPGSPVITTHSSQRRSYRLDSRHLRIPYVCCLNLGLKICYPDSLFVIFLSSSKQILYLCLKIGHNHFHIVSQLTITIILIFDAITYKCGTASLNEMEIRGLHNLSSLYWPVWRLVRVPQGKSEWCVLTATCYRHAANWKSNGNAKFVLY
jgi:hypothetical protein